jgi:hypothetical protein
MGEIDEDSSISNSTLTKIEPEALIALSEQLQEKLVWDFD